MAEISFKVLESIQNGKRASEICKELNISYNELSLAINNLKNKGLNIQNIYFEGDILYILERPVYKKSKSNNQDRINLTSIDDNIKTLAFSDLHLGSKYERLDLLQRAFNYCKKHNIHTIFFGGDFIEGINSKITGNKLSIYEQIEHFIRNYPSDNSIITFAVGGEKDLSIESEGYDLASVINTERQDIVFGGYNNYKVQMKDSSVVLHHYIGNGNGDGFNWQPAVILSGHNHRYQVYFETLDKNKLSISLPSLSDAGRCKPTAVELNIGFDDDEIRECSIKQIDFDKSGVDYVKSTYQNKLMPYKKRLVR